ncbi:MAG TPA: 4-hydroxy-3-methylbut-2-enyl diphosphate reductase, partial [Nitrospinaceae bacterium]|nr:4-hydroxy-3-methylbut-2-enyl diphosphate reductase [Nitrospinaceae bacterium]
KHNGVSLVPGIENIDKIKTKKVMITAHGASEKTKKQLQDAGFVVFDASCPLVMRVHQTIKSLVKKGYFPIVIGQKDHVEVKGIVGDLEDHLVINNEDDFEKIKESGNRKLGIVTQTTQQTDKVEHIVNKIRALDYVDEVAFVNTICQPTRDRQVAVHELADQVDLMIVIGGFNSSNTKKLVHVCTEKGVEAHHIESFHQLQKDWFVEKQHVGITAGTSTPESVINQVHSEIIKIADRIEGTEKEVLQS